MVLSCRPFDKYFENKQKTNKHTKQKAKSKICITVKAYDFIDDGNTKSSLESNTDENIRTKEINL